MIGAEGSSDWNFDLIREGCYHRRGPANCLDSDVRSNDGPRHANPEDDWPEKSS